MQFKRFISIENLATILLCYVAVFSSSESMLDSGVIPRQLFTYLALSICTIVISAKAIISKNLNFDTTSCSAIITLTGVCEAAYAIFQRLVYSFFDLDLTVSGNFDNPAGLAACLCLTLPFAIYMIGQFPKNKVVIYIAILLIFSGIIVSESRTGVITAIFVFADYLMRLKHIKAKRRILIMFLLILLLITVGYFINSASVDGRLLIWRCAWDMICDTPLTGFGHGAFGRLYMEYQSSWLQANPDSGYSQLASNPLVPFNEFINLYLNYGLAGLLILISVIALLIVSFWRRPSNEKYMALNALICVALLSSFSYPFTYPFTTVICILCVIIILKDFCNVIKSVRIILSLGLITISVFCSVDILHNIQNEKLWCKAYRTNNIDEFRLLSRDMNNTPHFLYSFATVLNDHGYIDESLEVAHRADSLISHYELKLLLGDIYLKRDSFNEAELYYKKASQMIPCRFIPLDALFNLYIETNDSTKATLVATEIINKPVKVPSQKIKLIKAKMKRFLSNSAEQDLKH